LKFLERLNPWFTHHPDGQVSVRWNRLAILILLATAVHFAVTFALSILFSTPFGLLSVLGYSITFTLGILIILYFAKRKAEKKPVWQVSIRALVAGTTILTLLLAISTCQREQELRKFAAVLKLEAQLKSVVGEEGRVTIGGNPNTTFIGSLKPDFNDDDLLKIIRATEDFPEAPITFLDLTGTKVTDAGATQLFRLKSLERLSLDLTSVTDRSIDDIQKLENLEWLNLTRTSVSTERLQKLKKSRDQLNIQAKGFN